MTTIETRPEDILEYWFGPNGSAFDARSDIWWGNVDDRDALDAEIRERFADALERIGDGELKHWREEPESRLAYIILIDQFSRNIHRGTAAAFAHDDRACEAVLKGIERGHDRELPPTHRLFFYMPLMHVETLELQNLGVEKFRELAEELPEGPQRDLVEGSLDHAVEHRDIIEKFGRFPHRNPVLDRPMTDEERAYLEETGNWYGQKPDADAESS